jgi:hypothetical protein
MAQPAHKHRNKRIHRQSNETSNPKKITKGVEKADDLKPVYDGNFDLEINLPVGGSDILAAGATGGTIQGTVTPGGDYLEAWFTPLPDGQETQLTVSPNPSDGSGAWKIDISWPAAGDYNFNIQGTLTVITKNGGYIETLQVSAPFTTS